MKTTRAACLLLMLFILNANAEELTVTVLDRDGNPVPDVAVYLEDPNPTAEVPAGDTFIMDQVDTRFVPHLLVVRKGSLVEFPNSDVIAHHVYSFSKPNDFILPLYKGNAHSPIRFEHAGVVTLGCNIHDDMLAYILVVDGPLFGKTGRDGRVSFDVPDAAGVSIRIWSPRIRDRHELQAKSNGAETVFHLQKNLRPVHGSDEGGIAWNEY